MQVGKGYIIRGPQTLSGTSGTFTGNFFGVPNNGVITTPINGQAYTPTPTTNPCVPTKVIANLIGNPYPSALDADSFLSDPANVNVVGGAIYQWSHNTPVSGATPGDSQYNYSVNDYTVYNRLGGVGTGRISGVDPSFFNSNRPTGKIGAGQGFIVLGLSNGNATFNNEMRNDGIGDNSQFYRLNDATKLVAPIVRNRIWLQIENTSSILFPKPFKETLLGYATGATNGYDRAFDTKVFSAVPIINLYSLTTPTTVCEPLTIQGRAITSPFNVNDVIQLGFVATVPTSTTQTFKITGFGDGIFAPSGQAYYLKDNLLNTINNLPYTFTLNTSVTTDNTRFQIVFKAVLNQVKPEYCGLTVPKMDFEIQAFSNLPSVGVDRHKWRVTRLSDGLVNSNLETGDRTFKFHLLEAVSPNFVLYNTSYDIKVSMRVNGVWQPYDVIGCTISTPTIPIRNVNCITVSSNTTPIYVNDFVSGVSVSQPLPFTTKYKFKLRSLSGANDLFFTNTYAQCHLKKANFVEVSGTQSLLPSTQYMLSVQVIVNNTYIGNFGPECLITTPSNVNRFSTSNSSDSIIISPNPFENTFNIDVKSIKNEKIQVKVYDILGKLLDDKEFIVSNYKNIVLGEKYLAGIYNVVILDGEEVKSFRIIKK